MVRRYGRYETNMFGTTFGKIKLYQERKEKAHNLKFIKQIIRNSLLIMYIAPYYVSCIRSLKL